MGVEDVCVTGGCVDVGGWEGRLVKGGDVGGETVGENGQELNKLSCLYIIVSTS